MSRVFDRHWLMEGVANQMRRQGSGYRYTGTMTPQNFATIEACAADHLSTGTRLIFTWDVGHHSSGWWKNPDYERCWHLSLSFRDPLTGASAPKDARLTGRWIDAFYGDDRRYVWAEPPYSVEGKRRDTWHYRVFCDPAWHPIVPRGEVYNTELAEAGWLSFSELQGAHARALADLDPLPGEQ